MIYHPHAIYYRAFLASAYLGLGLPETLASLPIHPVHEDLPECGCGQCNLAHCITLRPPCPTWTAIADIQRSDDEEEAKNNDLPRMHSKYLQQTGCFYLQILTAATGTILLQVSCAKRRFPGVLARWFIRQTFSFNPNADDWQCSYISPKQGVEGTLCPLDYTCIVLDFLPEIWQNRRQQLTISLVWHKKHVCSYCHGQSQAYPIALPMPMPCCQLCGDRPADHHPCCCPFSCHHQSLWSTGRFWCAEKMYGGDMELLLQQILMPQEQLRGPATTRNLEMLYREGHTLLPLHEPSR